MKKKIFLILCIIHTVVLCKGQHYYFQNYQADDGLLHSNVTSIIQDKKGFMWIGTKGGLNRFDGYSFKNFLIPRNRSGANFISALCEDKKGIIWVGTQSGIFRYNPYKESFEELKIQPIPIVYDLTTDQDDNLWIISRGMVYKYDQNTHKINSTKIEASAFNFDNQGNLWIGTFRGDLKKLNVRTKKISKIKIASDRSLHGQQNITKIVPVKDEILIGTTKQGLFSYNVKTGKTKSLLSKNPDGTEVYVRDIKAASNQKYWVATESGIYIYNPATSTYTNIKKRAGDNYSLTDNAVYTLCQDNQGGIWAGTFFGGLNYLSVENNQFEKYYPLNTANSISGNAVREICQDGNGNIWIGTEDAGINKLELKSGKFSHFTTGNSPSNVSYPNIHGLLAAGNKLFVGPFVHGLEVLDLSSGKVTERYPMIPSGDNRTNTFVMSIFKTSDQRILIGTTGAGLHYYESGKKSFTKIPYIPDNSFVYTITEDHTGTIWTGSLQHGAFYFNPKTGEHGNISFNKNKDVSSNDYVVQGIYEDTDQAIWFATEGGGLIKLSKDRKTFKRFTTKNGFPTNNIYRFLEDDAKNLWISSLKGLICFNLITEKFQIYTKSNGLLTDQFNYNSAFKDNSGKMYFGSVKGMIAFRPENLKKPKAAPFMYITAFQLNNKDLSPQDSVPLLKKSILLTDSIRLKYNQSNFNIEFAALDYSSPEVIRYKYRMEGLDKDWTYLATNRKAYFTDLSPGLYKFVVQAESNTGSWMGRQRTVVIQITPPFWKSLPAYLLYFIATILGVYLIITFYHQTIDKRNQRKLQLFELEKEKEIYQAKIEFFTNIAHEIQTPLTLIKGPIEWALSKIEDIPTVRRNLKLVKKNTNRLIALTSQLLDFRKTEISQFGLNFVSADINYLLNDQMINFKSQLEKRNLDLTMDLPKEHIKAFVDKEAFIKIISNLISNAIKYSDRRIMIRLLYPEDDQDNFRIRIMNDGDLISTHYEYKIFEPFYRIESHKVTQGTGIGLSLAKSLTELHQGTLMLIKNNEELNIFELTIPLRQKIEFELGSWKNLN